MSPRKSLATLLLLILAALALRTPALKAGFFSDDYVHQAVLELGDDFSPYLKWWSLYDFGEMDGSEAMRIGFPFWTDEDWKIRFFRPLPSLSIALDHALFGTNSLGYTVTGLLLFGLLLGSAFALYRRLGLAPAAALLAVAIVGVDDGTSWVVGWTAGRNALIGALFAVWSVHAALGRGRIAVPLALACAALGCLAKESGVVTCALVALVFARGLCGSPRRPVAAGLALAIAAGFVVFWLGSGYGTRSVFYPMPWTFPESFAINLLTMFTAGLAGFVHAAPVDILFMQPGALWPLVAIGAVTVALVATFVMRWTEPGERRLLLALFGLAFVVPQAGVQSADRLLMIPSIGLAALLAEAVVRALRRQDGARGWRRAAPIFLLFLLLPINALMLLQRGLQMAEMAPRIRRAIVESDVGSPELGRRRVVILQSPSELVSFSWLPTWVCLERDLDLDFEVLVHGRRRLEIERVSETGFTLRSPDEPLISRPLERVFLTRAKGPEGEEAHWAGEHTRLDVRATLNEDRTIDELRVETDLDLDDERWRFLAWDGERLRDVALPAPGKTLLLGAPAPFHPMFP